MSEHWHELSRGDGCCDLLGRLKEAYDEQHAEIERLRALVVKYEAIAATVFGTLEAPPEPEPPFTVTPADTSTPR